MRPRGHRQGVLAGSCVLAAVALAGCGTDAVSQVDTVAPVATATPAAAPLSSSSADTGWCADNPPPVFTGEAVERYGLDEVTAAYCSVAEYTMNVATFDPELVKDPEREPADFAFLTAAMTPKGRAYFEEKVQAAMLEDAESTPDGSQSASSSVRVIAYFGFSGTESADALVWPEDDDQLVTGKSVTDPSVGVGRTDDGTEQLQVTLTAVGALHMTINDTPYVWDSTKTVTYGVVPGAEPGSWLIDSYKGTWSGNGVIDAN